MYFWADTNPKAGGEVSFWESQNLLLGPHVFQGTLNGAKYWNFLLGDLPRILHEERVGKESFTSKGGWCRGVILTRRPKLAEWKLSDLDRPRGTESWPARSTDLIPMDFFVWGLMKQEVHSAPVNSEDELLNRINSGAVKFREARTYKATVAPIHKRSRACVRENGGYFENKLWRMSLLFYITCFLLILSLVLTGFKINTFKFVFLLCEVCSYFKYKTSCIVG